MSLRLIGGTPLHVYSLLLIYGERYNYMIEYTDLQDTIEWRTYVLLKYFTLPNSLFCALNMLAKFPILNMSIPSKRDIETQRSLLKRRTLCIIPIIIFERCQNDNTWVISVNLAKRHEHNCFFLMRYPHEPNARQRCQREYNNLKSVNVPWMTIWECLADVIKFANLIS